MVASVRTAVICAAGRGTRLLSATKQQPKEMLPIFAPVAPGVCSVKPMLQLVFEQLHDFGIRRFCFVVGRGRRIIADHFSQDREFIRSLQAKPENDSIRDLRRFYGKLDDSDIHWATQPKPIGFGDAVLRAKKAVGADPFLVHAGDTHIISEGNLHLRRLIEAFNGERPEAVFLFRKTTDVRDRGVFEGAQISKGVFSVERVIEKPKHPCSNLAIEPVYVFTSSILDHLQRLAPGKNDEVQLTDGIQRLIESGKMVLAVDLDGCTRLDIGNPVSYWHSLQRSFEASTGTT
jgi:UTP--glucose-1-phosphate uridylyltransferase